MTRNEELIAELIHAAIDETDRQAVGRNSARALRALPGIISNIMLLAMDLGAYSVEVKKKLDRAEFDARQKAHEAKGA